MAVINIAKLETDRDAEVAFVDGQGIKSGYTQTYQVLTDAVVEDLDDILLLAGQPFPGPDILPKIGWAWSPSNDGASVSRYELKAGESSYQFFVTVIYENPPAGGFGANPPDLDWTFSISQLEEERIAEYDYGGHGSLGGDGNATVPDPSNPNNTLNNIPPLEGSAGKRNIRNSAEDIFDPPLMATQKLRVYNLRKFVSTWDEEEALKRVDTINSAPVTLLGVTFPKYSLYCPIYETGGLQSYQNGTYFDLVVQLIYRPYFTVKHDDNIHYVAGWLDAILDRGFNEKVGGVKRAIMGTDNEVVTKPRLLDGNGQERSDSTYYPHYLQFRTKKLADMTAWGLPQTTNLTIIAP